MQNRVVFFLICALVSAAAVSVAFAQRQINDTGWIEIGSKTETARVQRPLGTLYRGSGFLTYVGKPKKPNLQHDMGAYELDPAPESDRNKPHNKRDLTGVYEKLAGGMSDRVPKMTPLGWQMMDERITAGGPRAYLSETIPVNNPELLCDPQGWPGAVFGTDRPMENIQIPGRLIQHWAWHESWRTIWLDGRLLPKTPDPTWYGYSVGKWVGNTLVADTIGVDSRIWVTDNGAVLGPNAELNERWRRLDNNTLQFNITIRDPEIYVEDWSSTDVLFQRYPNLEVDHSPCVPSEELLYRSNSPTEIPGAGQ